MVYKHVTTKTLENQFWVRNLAKKHEFDSKSAEELKFQELLTRSIVPQIDIKHMVVLHGQYGVAYELLKDSLEAYITPCLVGPPGVGKSLLARKISQDLGRPFYELFFDENVTPSRLIGSFDPALVARLGRNTETFEPGPLIKAMVEGGIFLAQELNRATEFCQNSLISPLEEKHYYIYPIGLVKADERFSLIATQNPIEHAGTYRLSHVLMDRVGCWIRLDYPDEQTELEIVKVNVPELNLSEDTLRKIYKVVASTRTEPIFEVPASPRAGIFLAQLVNKYASKFDSEDDAIRFFAIPVLRKEIKVKGPKSIEQLLNETTEKVLKGEA